MCEVTRGVRRAQHPKIKWLVKWTWAYHNFFASAPFCQSESSVIASEVVTNQVSCRGWQFMSFVVVFFCVIFSRNLYRFCLFHFRFAFAKQHAPQEHLENEAVVLVRRLAAFVQASVIVGQEMTDLVRRLPFLRTCENYSKALNSNLVCCYRFALQIKKHFGIICIQFVLLLFLKLDLKKKSVGRSWLLFFEATLRTGNYHNSCVFCENNSRC